MFFIHVAKYNILLSGSQFLSEVNIPQTSLVKPHNGTPLLVKKNTFNLNTLPYPLGLIEEYYTVLLIAK